MRGRDNTYKEIKKGRTRELRRERERENGGVRRK